VRQTGAIYRAYRRGKTCLGRSYLLKRLGFPFTHKFKTAGVGARSIEQEEWDESLAPYVARFMKLSQKHFVFYVSPELTLDASPAL
jgi:hypothetical protein